MAIPSGISMVETTQMRSLYDLLGADQNDDADALKKAFRRAVKASHPDLHPGDKEAEERFREIIAANARLRDAKERATYDWLLQLERERIQVRLERQQRRSTLARQQLRLKRMRTTAAAATVGALISGYWLFAPMLTTTTLEISEDQPVASTGAMVEEERQTATVVAVARENENPPIATAAPKANVVKTRAEGNVDNAGRPVETAGEKVMAPTDALDAGGPRDKHDSREVPNGASKPSTDKHDDAQPSIRANKPSADKHEDAEVLNEANKLSDEAVAIMRIVMQRLRDGGDAQATAGRELALGPPAADKHKDLEVANGANKASANKYEGAKVLNEANKPSDARCRDNANC